jgi:hypothetical protein
VTTHLDGYAYLPEDHEEPTTWIVPETVPLRMDGKRGPIIGEAHLTKREDGTIMMTAELADGMLPDPMHTELAIGLRVGPDWSNPLKLREEKLKLVGATVQEVYTCSGNEDPWVPPYVLWSDDAQDNDH